MPLAHNWAELKYGKRFIKLGKEASERLRAKNPEQDPDVIARNRREYIYSVLSDSHFNKLAAYVGSFIGLCILLSTITFILETVPELARSANWRWLFFGAELFFVTVFTTEICVRFWAFPCTTLTFFKDPMNIVDVVSILPFYIELVLVAIYGSASAMMDLRVLRALRLMRMMKMGRFSSQLHMVGEGLFRSRGAFLMLCCTLSVGTVFFSAMMWIIERGDWAPGLQCYSRVGEPFMNGCSPFESVPVGFWWAITTMTTVGYGDTFPVTPGGKMVAGVAMMAGIFCVAIPTGMLCTEFAKLYEEQAHVVRKPDPMDAGMRLRPREELELFLSSESLGTLRNEIEAHLEYMYCLSNLHTECHGEKDAKGIEMFRDSCMLYQTFASQAVSGIDSIKSVLHDVTDELKKPQVPFGNRGHSPGPSPRYP